MKEVNYNKKLDILFEKWKIESGKNGHTGFCADGLMFRGGKGKDDNYVWREPGDENNLWLNAPKRILFLLKDTNGNPNDDNREFYPGGNGKIDLANRNIAYWFYGLLNFNEEKDAPDFDSLDFKNDVYPTFDSMPYAFVNCKKESGGSTISDGVLREHIELYTKYIKEEIEILDPDIIVCGGGSSIIKNFVIKKIYTDVDPINNWIYYDKKNNKVIIDSYHPSYFQIEGGSNTIYTKMMESYKAFLAKYPNFRKSCRK